MPKSRSNKELYVTGGFGDTAATEAGPSPQRLQRGLRYPMANPTYSGPTIVHNTRAERQEFRADLAVRRAKRKAK